MRHLNCSLLVRNLHVRLQSEATPAAPASTRANAEKQHATAAASPKTDGTAFALSRLSG